MIDIHLFGITTPTGKYIERIFKNKSEEYNLIGYSRSNKMYKSINFEVENLLISSNKSILISCAPIWDFANFINNFSSFSGNPIQFHPLNKLICIFSKIKPSIKKSLFNNNDL